jgi:hypothetical protein
MTHDELVDKINNLPETIGLAEFKVRHDALLAVVELHKPSNRGFNWMPLDYCDICIKDPGDYQPTQDIKYPCSTIEAIQKELL